jgi:hypothetical protein
MISVSARAHYDKLSQIEFGASATKTKGRLIVRCRFRRLMLVMRMATPWKCAVFCVGALDEQELNPEGQSKHKVFQYLTN